ncbi:AraC family transcriptional regulator [Aquincola sp. S2]|uniref:AraC family transcriptional regulator n=1 Tax=Pseudaquabacterium terrae TaxID=2732868 RepID=A0ABX2EIE1_9BURK|nr:AraC family transcriptional regulator [Aquabacterium terrae]NRF68341.1 AraC family transcriptional regulator [Aquabacterium terrae]
MSACADPASLARYEARLQRVIEHVHARLDEPLDLMRLADVACLSPYHWHRIYHAIYGETLAATVKRLRLHRAAGELANTALPVERIARHAGYPNLQSFTRIFKSVYRLPPARYRAAGDHATFRQAIAQADGGHSAAEVDIRHLPALELVVANHRGSYMQIGQAFDLLYGCLGARGLLRPGMRSLALYLDDPSAVEAAALRSQAGVAGSVPMDAPPAPLQHARMTAGPYAVLRHRGPYASMNAAYRWLFGTWLPQSGHDAADAPVVEEYLNNPRDTAPADLLTDICLPLKPD